MRGDWDALGDPLVALRDGDMAVFEMFVRTETSTFLGFFRRLGAALDEAEDLAQEVFVRLVRYAPRYRDQDRFEAFCFRTARNVWIDNRRARGTRRAERAGGDDELANVSDDTPEPLEPLALEEESRRALELIATLPEGQRLVFELGVIQERPYPEIAVLLGIPVGTVKSRMFNAVRRLREQLERPEAAGDTHRTTAPQRPATTAGARRAPDAETDHTEGRRPKRP
ncbi:RNA polymerase sigma factor [Planctomycetes bacterium Pla163]